MLVTFFVKIKLLQIYIHVHRFWEWNYFWNACSLVALPLSMWHSDLSQFSYYLTSRRLFCHPCSILLHSPITYLHMFLSSQLPFDTAFRWRFGVIPSWQAQIEVKKSEQMKSTAQLTSMGTYSLEIVGLNLLQDQLVFIISHAWIPTKSYMVVEVVVFTYCDNYKR